MSARIKVVHVLATGNTYSRGLAQTVLNLTRTLDASRYSLSVVFMREGGPLADELSARGVNTLVARWSGGFADFKGAARFGRALARSRSDIVHLHAGGLGPRILAKSFRWVKVIAHYHSLREESGVAKVKPRSALFADLVIANSAATAETIRNSSPVVVHPGVPHHPRVIRRARSVSAPLRMGVASRLVPVKGISDLIAATAALRNRGIDARLDIAGAGPERASLASAAESSGIGDYVRFLGWVVDITAPMREWDLYLHPSHSEGLGISILEAMMAGLPVVAAAVGGVPEVVLEGETGFLVRPADSAGLAERIARLARCPELALRMGERARERATTQFSVEREAAEIESAYRRVLA